MLAASEWRIRRAEERADRILGAGRLVDMGVRIHVVRQDLEHGAEVISGMAPVGSLRTHELGGIWDCALKRWVGPSVKPRIWWASERAIDVILHADDMDDCQLALGGMGSGKTLGILRYHAVAQAIRLADYAPIEMGCTAPTDQRLEELIVGMQQCMRSDWYSYSDRTKLFRLRTGVRIRCIGLAKRSRAQGSRCQGWNWAACDSDELEDSCEENANIDARGRRAPGGRYKRCSTATPKDDPDWRNLLAKLRASGEWNVRRFVGQENQFVLLDFWERLKRKLTDREYDRIVLAKDVGPERQTYHTYDRDENVVQIPLLGVKDITRQVLSRFGRNFAVLCGHDPGTRFDVTEVLKAYQIGIDPTPYWWVVDEITTERTTAEEHATALLDRLRTKWGCNRLDYKGRPLPDSPRAHVRADPYGDTDEGTHRTVYQTFAAHGLDIASAAYGESKIGSGKVVGAEPHKLPRNAGIDMVCRLLCNAAKERRLRIDCDDMGQPVAPKLAAAFESSSRDLSERAEQERKGSDEDLSHWPATIRYALWALERLPKALRRMEA